MFLVLDKANPVVRRYTMHVGGWTWVKEGRKLVERKEVTNNHLEPVQQLESEKNLIQFFQILCVDFTKGYTPVIASIWGKEGG